MIYYILFGILYISTGLFLMYKKIQKDNSNKFRQSYYKDVDAGSFVLAALFWPLFWDSLK